jgi:hypothetical protein
MGVLIFGLLTTVMLFVVAELFGRSKHIGRWWSFLLLWNFIIPGVLAIILSPSAKDKPTNGTKAHILFGWIVILLLGVMGIIPSLLSGNYVGISSGVAFIFTGVYLVQLGKSKIINNTPKYYFFKTYDTFTNSSNANIINKIKTLTSSQSIKSKRYLYFIVENGKQSKPLTFDQLKEKHIDENTLVWRKGLKDWIQAKYLHEIKNILIFMPPPFNQNVEFTEKEIPPPFNK